MLNNVSHTLFPSFRNAARVRSARKIRRSGACQNSCPQEGGESNSLCLNKNHEAVTYSFTTMLEGRVCVTISNDCNCHVCMIVPLPM